MIGNRKHILFAMVLAFALTSSCSLRERWESEPESDVTANNPYEGQIVVKVGNASSVTAQTRSAVGGGATNNKTYLGLFGKDSLFLSSTVVDNLDPVFTTVDNQTKGTPVTTENLNEFYLMANMSEEMKYFDILHIDESDKTNDVYVLDYYWPNAALDFYAANFDLSYTSPSIDSMEEVMANPGWTKSAVQNSNTIPVDWEENQMGFGYDMEGRACGRFAYSLPGPDLTTKQDALNQPDYVVAIAEDVDEEFVTAYHDGAVPLNFAHCFTAVTFKLGSEFMNAEGRQVRQISISGVPSSGICTYAPDGNGSVLFDWNTDGSSINTYTQSIAFDGDQTNVSNLEVINDGEFTFMLIPHEIRDDAKISITFAMHEDKEEVYQYEVVVEKNIKDLFAEPTPPQWLAGKKYIYTFVSEEKVDIEVTDEFVSNEPMVKGNLSITNTGNAAVYVRAYIVGWWENSDGIVVAPWTQNDGQWSGAAWEKPTSNWIISQTDGFMYFKEPLLPGQETEKLFDTYTLTSVPPSTDAKLVLNVLTQAVLHYQVEQVWPQATASVDIKGFEVSNTESYW